VDVRWESPSTFRLTILKKYPVVDSVAEPVEPQHFANAEADIFWPAPGGLSHIKFYQNQKLFREKIVPVCQTYREKHNPVPVILGSFYTEYNRIRIS
jgi:hypothetical protein